MNFISRRSTHDEWTSGGSRTVAFPCRTVISPDAEFLDALYEIQNVQNRIYMHSNYDPAPIRAQYAEKYPIPDDTTYESVWLTYRPMPVAIDNPYIAQIPQHAVWFANGAAIVWLEKKNIQEMANSELSDRAAHVRAWLLENGFSGKHIALIGQTSPEWLISYFGIVTGPMTAVPLDALLPDEDLISLLNRSDASAVFLSRKRKNLADIVQEKCPEIERVIMLSDISDIKATEPLVDAEPAPEDVSIASSTTWYLSSSFISCLLPFSLLSA